MIKKLQPSTIYQWEGKLLRRMFSLQEPLSKESKDITGKYYTHKLRRRYN